MNNSKIRRNVSVVEVKRLKNRLAKLENINRDIIESVEYDSALGNAWLEWEQTFDATRDAIIITDKEFNIIQVNASASRMFALSYDNILGKKCWELVNKSDKNPIECPLRRALKTKQHEETQCYLQEKDIWVEIYIDPILDEKGTLNGAVHTIRDITDRKNVEEQLRKSENEKATILQTISEVVIYQDKKHQIKWANQAACEAYGYKPSEIIGCSCFKIFLNRSQPCSECPVSKALNSGQLETSRVADINGRIWSIRAYPVLSSKGNIEGVVEVALDITAQKEAEKKLRQEKDKAKKYLDIVGVIVLVLDSQARVALINKKGCEILGYPEEEILGKNWFDNFIPERVRDSVRIIFRDIINGYLNQWEYAQNMIITKAGRERLIGWHNTLLRNDNDAVIGILCSGHDITDQKTAERQLLKYQKELKSLASSLAMAQESERVRIATELHDRVSQSLVFSKLRLQQIRQYSENKTKKELSEICELIDSTISEMRSLIFDLGTPILKELGLERTIAEWLVEEIENKRNIKTEFIDDGKPKPLDCEVATVMFRNVRELLVNAVKHAGARTIKVRSQRVNNYISISVLDDGCGFIASENEVFGTNRGFGLMSIKETLEHLGGRIEIDTRSGRGSKITIYAPIQDHNND